MAVKISKGAIVPAKRQLTIEWDGDTTDLYEYIFHGVPMWKVCDEALENIEALRGAVIYLSDGSVEIIDGEKFSTVFCNAQRIGTEVTLAGNDLVRASLRGARFTSDNATSMGSGVFLFNDGTRYVKKLVLPNALEQLPIGKAVREECWCIDYDFYGYQAGGDYVYPNWVDEHGEARRPMPGRTYRITLDGKDYIGESAGNDMTRTIKIDGNSIISCKDNGHIRLYVNDNEKHKISITELIESNPIVADAAGSAPTALEFNALLAALRDAGILAN